MSYSDADLRERNRVKTYEDLTSNQQIAFRYYGDMADITPLQWANDGEESFATFEQCFDKRLNEKIYSNKDKYAT